MTSRPHQVSDVDEVSQMNTANGQVMLNLTILIHLPVLKSIKDMALLDATWYCRPKLKVDQANASSYFPEADGATGSTH